MSTDQNNKCFLFNFKQFFLSLWSWDQITKNLFRDARNTQIHELNIPVHTATVDVPPFVYGKYTVGQKAYYQAFYKFVLIKKG